MNRPVLRVIGLLCVAFVAVDAEDIDAMQAREVIKKAADAMNSLPGYHFTLHVYVQGADLRFSAECVYVKPDVYHVMTKEGLEIYFKGAKALVRQGADQPWKDPRGLDATSGRILAIVFNNRPAAILATMSSAKSAELAGSTKQGEVEMKTIETPGPLEDVKRLFDLVPAEMLELKKGAKKAIDPDLADFKWRAGVGCEDFLVRFLTAKIHAEQKVEPGKKLDPSFKYHPLDEEVCVEIDKHGEELDLGAPDEVKRKLGLQ